MPVLTVAPTKSNLIREREYLALATEGHELLDRKREILVLELLREAEKARQLEAEFEAAARSAYAMMRRCIFRLGREGLRELAEGITSGATTKESVRRVAGIRIPTVDAVIPGPRLQCSFMNSFAESDETMLEFTRLLKMIVDMSNAQSIIWRLAAELRKTQRRVNALEKLVIPASKSRKNAIESALEEAERSAVFTVKLLKARRTKRDRT